MRGPSLLAMFRCPGGQVLPEGGSCLPPVAQGGWAAGGRLSWRQGAAQEGAKLPLCRWGRQAPPTLVGGAAWEGGSCRPWEGGSLPPPSRWGGQGHAPGPWAARWIGQSWAAGGAGPGAWGGQRPARRGATGPRACWAAASPARRSTGLRPALGGRPWPKAGRTVSRRSPAAACRRAGRPGSTVAGKKEPSCPGGRRQARASARRPAPAVWTL
ncbi:translation initiation factor IF-2-like, partial [Jatropha curcas]|uniref:translation initiation factor IF-2-like n=1 Tax=Jatropha curcas TaxID=180498 RepID=UPI0018954E0D